MNQICSVEWPRGDVLLSASCHVRQITFPNLRLPTAIVVAVTGLNKRQRQLQTLLKAKKIKLALEKAHA
jgi:hypothetical protein